MPMNNGLRKKWAMAGYRTTMGSAAVVPPPSKEFIRVYHVTTAEHAISDIALGRLKVARFSDLNDPFELMAVNFREGRTRTAIKEFRAQYDSHTGLLCFSADWTDPVLWSHYGAKHRGVCLGFNVTRKLAEEVKYEDKRLLAELDKHDDPTQLDAKLQGLLRCTKFRHWEYEEEYRFFVALADARAEGKLHFFPFDESLRLAEVILGPQCELSLDAVRELTGSRYPDAIVFRARLAWGHFAVVPMESTVP